MLTKLYKQATVFATAILVLAMTVVTPVAAAAGPATDRAGATGPLAGALQIEPGAVHWYQFKYKYDNNGAEPVPVTVLLKMSAAGCVAFDVETPGTLATPAGQKHYPIGIGSPLTKKEPDLDKANEAKNADDAEDTTDNGQIDDEENPYDQQEHGTIKNEQVLVWVGGGRATETFYIVVKNQSKAACDYQLTISGPTVSFPAPPAAPSTPTPTATAQAAKHKQSK